MTKKEIYEELIQLTSEFYEINVARKLFSIAKKGDPYKVEEFFETFKVENSDLYQRSINFAEKLKTSNEIDLGIFGEDTDAVFYKFKKKNIDGPSLYAIILIAEINEYDLFKNWCSQSAIKFIADIKKKGFKELAKFVEEYSWCDWVPDQYHTWYELLVDIFKGDY